MNELNQKAQDAFDHYVSVARQYYPQLNVTEFTLVIRSAKAMKTVAGRAKSSNVVELNAFFLETETENMLHDTIPHEISHLIQYMMYPYAKQAHGPEWKRIMKRVFRLEPRRCHSYDSSALVKNGIVRKQSRFIYQCSECCSSYKLSKTRHNKLLAKPNFYICKCSNTNRLVFLGNA